MASGKATPCDAIIQQPHRRDIVERRRGINSVLEQDMFFRGLTLEELENVHDYNFDHPDAFDTEQLLGCVEKLKYVIPDAFDTEQLLECVEKLKCGQPVHVPIYGLKTHQRCSDSFLQVNACDVIILEGILVFHDQRVRNLINMKVFVDIDADVRLARRIRPDILERGRDINSVLEQDIFYRGLTLEELEDVHDYNFDHPDAFDTEQLLECVEKLKCGQPVHVPIYDLKTHQRCSDSFLQVNVYDLIIPEGVLIFHDQRVRNLMNMKVFVDTDADVRLARRIRPYIVERDRDMNSVLEQIDECLAGARNMDQTDEESTTSEWNHEAIYRGAGLINRNRTCYMNAVIQCLVHSAKLFDCIVSDTKHGLECTCRGEPPSFCLLHCLKRLFNQLTSGYEKLWPCELIENLAFFSPTSSAEGENNASDMDEASSMDMDEEDDASDSSHSSFDMDREADSAKFLECFYDKLVYCQDDTADYNVGDLFMWVIVNKVRCFKCHEATLRYTVNWSFEIWYGFKDRTLENALERMMLERREGCEKCKVESYCRGLIAGAPEIAIFVLKYKDRRSKKVKRGRRRVQRLSYPMELDLQRFSTGELEELKYDLYAMIVLTGGTDGFSHAYALARTDPDKWFKFNDEQVSRVENVLREKAYVLFYAKRGSPWFYDVVLKHKILKEVGRLTRLRHTRRRRYLMWRPLSLFARTLQRRSQFHRRAQ